VYLKAYDSVAEARDGTGKWIEYYNNQMRHQSLNRLTPGEVYDGHAVCDGYPPSREKQAA